MASVTGMEIVKGAFGILGSYAIGETPTGADGDTARTYLNDLLSEWGQRDLFIPVISRERFTMTSGKGSPTNPYTIGIGGDLNTERPSNQNSIVSANLIQTATSPEVRIPLGIYTDDGYDANQLPTMSNTLPTGLYYNPTYANELGSVFLWPVPDTSQNDLELFLQKSVAQFANLTSTYYVPDGMPRMMKYNLADAMQFVMGRALSPGAERIAIATMSAFKRSNFKLTDVGTDATWAGDRRTIYNIQTGAGG